jgi:acyl carrier protein
MTPARELSDPFDIVAQALACDRASLSIDSAMYRDHGWDSFGHLRVILAIEEAYSVPINDKNIEKYTTIRAIKELYDELRAVGHD